MASGDQRHRRRRRHPRLEMAIRRRRLVVVIRWPKPSFVPFKTLARLFSLPRDPAGALDLESGDLFPAVRPSLKCPETYPLSPFTFKK